MPPYTSYDDTDSVSTFVNGLEVGKIPGIGFKLAQKLRAHVLQRPVEEELENSHRGTEENVLVGQVKQATGLGAETLERILAGPGTPHGIGVKIWGLLNGCDDSEVAQARHVPRQISIENTYLRLDTVSQVERELLALSQSLLRRMRADLLDDGEDVQTLRRWLAFPKTLRLSTRTRPRPPQQATDEGRNRSFARTCRSAPVPGFVFNVKEPIDGLAERLVKEALLPLFRKLHPEKSGWNLGLVNVGVTNMADSASGKGGGRDIGEMFRGREVVMGAGKASKESTLAGAYDPSKESSLVESSVKPDRELLVATASAAATATTITTTTTTTVAAASKQANKELSLVEDLLVGSDSEMMAMDKGPKFAEHKGSEDVPTTSQQTGLGIPYDGWKSEEDVEAVNEDDEPYCCEECGAVMPLFAMGAHARWHAY